MDKQQLMQKWLCIFEAENEVYIYGAAKSAERIYNFAKDTVDMEKIKGFMVSDASENPDEWCGLNVYEAGSVANRNAAILVLNEGIHKKHICQLLGKLGYNNVIIAADFQILYRKKEWEPICDEEMELANREIESVILSKSEGRKKKDAEICSKIRKMLVEGNPDFGRMEPYQSLDFVGLSGMRSTLYRIYKYGLRGIVNKKSHILDIGCNTGFVDLMMAQEVESIVGIEYDLTLVNIANMVKEYLNIKNCSFINADFNEWRMNNVERYSVVFSFAIHHWLNIKPSEYADILYALLDEDGYVVIESHERGLDSEYDECCKCLDNKELYLLKNGVIKDDGELGVSEREFRVYWKQR